MLNEIAGKINGKVNEPEAGDHSITVNSSDILKVCETLKADGFKVLHVISGVDYPERNVIELSYMLSDYTQNRDLMLKTEVAREGASLDSVSGVWKAANWQEREAYDMLGMTFNNHPDHRRILCPDDWEGHPLKKDYVVQEVYNGMTVNPAEKVNTEDHFFGKKLIQELGDPKRVSWSWKDNDGDAAEATES
jgi:NADH-quinone oxidoreductase subunit C